jgi:hypothetical protein
LETWSTIGSDTPAADRCPERACRRIPNDGFGTAAASTESQLANLGHSLAAEIANCRLSFHVELRSAATEVSPDNDPALTHAGQNEKPGSGLQQMVDVVGKQSRKHKHYSDHHKNIHC